MPAIRSVTVFCASSTDLDPAYTAAAEALAAAIVRAGWTVVYGGNHVGLMGAVADAARAAGGRVVGITTQLLHDRGLSDPAADELHVAADMGTRKAMLAARADAFVALPGGLGTYEELFEVIVGRQLGYHAKPIVLVDTAGYYRPLMAMIDHGIAGRFIKSAARDYVHMVATADAAVAHLRAVGSGTAAGPAIDPARPPSSIE